MTTTTISGPPTPTPTRRPATSLRQAAPALIALCLAMLVEMLDNTVLNVALPTIGRDLAAGTTGLQWMVAAYSLTFGGLLLVGGTLGDRFGRRRMLLVGLAGFGASSALVSLVETSAQFIAVRALTGVFAAMIAPGTMSLAFRLFEDSKLRQRAIGLIVSVAMIGFALGPIASGIAVTHLPWQVLLLINVPTALIAIVGVRWGIAADDQATLRTGAADVLGAVLSIATISLGLYTLTLGASDGWTAATTLLTGAAAVASGCGFWVREHRATSPMIDFTLFSQPTVRGGALLQTSVMMAMVGVAFATTQLFQSAWGWSPMKAGIATLPMVLGMFLAAPLVDKTVETLGHRWACMIGSGAALLSIAIIGYGIGHGYLFVGTGLLVMTVGVRFVMTTSAMALLEALPESHTSVGSALNDTAQELGNSIGVAVVGTVMATVMGVNLPDHVWGPELVQQFIRSQHIALAIIGCIVAAFAAIGARALTDSRSTEE